MRNGVEGSVEVGWAKLAVQLAWMVPFGSFCLTLILRRFIPTT